VWTTLGRDELVRAIGGTHLVEFVYTAGRI
jgi:hypothetical protein